MYSCSSWNLRATERHLPYGITQCSTCHPAQVSVPCFNPSHAGRYSIYLPRRDGRLSLPCYSETQPPGVELTTSWSRVQRPNHWATKQHICLHFSNCCCNNFLMKLKVQQAAWGNITYSLWLLELWTCDWDEVFTDCETTGQAENFDASRAAAEPGR